MCGRFTRYLTWSEIHGLYRLTLDWEKQRNDEPNYNVCPTDEVPFVTAGENGAQKLHLGRWWLVPWWAKEMPKAAMFNARIETADSSGAFKDAWRTTRCLIPADGFYEWTKNPGDDGRDPWHIHLPDHQPFSFAGLWAYNKRLDVTSCTIITMAAAEPISQLHDRQPAILDPAAYDEWLDPSTPGETLKPLLFERNIDSQLRFYRVGREVNSNKAKGPKCIEPVNPL
ncbi:SOS response-associated peptidase [Chelativorans sp.]|uniref:SOS response-associated peptidase n=1 Tax=Chelativorans sp. TaxID=2203393 RepID=UPI0028123C36|nr:SOS response-associated peptidase [Chelativorans sp.]